ncbi:MAG: hypothetical protein OXE76_04640 [Alphaproteobacteria bacterium]|nr:hypothetical protein [Alphaproteobacteria bacterium]
MPAADRAPLTGDAGRMTGRLDWFDDPRSTGRMTEMAAGRRMDRLFGAGLVALDWAAGGFAAWLCLGWWRAGTMTNEKLVLLGLGAVVAALVRTALVVPAVRYGRGNRGRSN